jgi:hypothetical protein
MMATADIASRIILVHFPYAGPKIGLSGWLENCLISTEWRASPGGRIGERLSGMARPDGFPSTN